MTIKELKRQLKGEYTNIIPFHTDHRNVIPYTMLGKEFNGLYGKKFMDLLDTKEVVDYKLSEWQKEACFNLQELAKSGKGHYEMSRTLTIYFKWECYLNG